MNDKTAKSLPKNRGGMHDENEIIGATLRAGLSEMAHHRERAIFHDGISCALVRAKLNDVLFTHPSIPTPTTPKNRKMNPARALAAA